MTSTVAMSPEWMLPTTFLGGYVRMNLLRRLRRLYSDTHTYTRSYTQVLNVSVPILTCQGMRGFQNKVTSLKKHCGSQ